MQIPVLSRLAARLRAVDSASGFSTRHRKCGRLVLGDRISHDQEVVDEIAVENVYDGNVLESKRACHVV